MWPTHCQVSSPDWAARHSLGQSSESTHFLVLWDEGFVGVDAMRCQKLGYLAPALKPMRVAR
jgi:hypothetical protein